MATDTIVRVDPKTLLVGPNVRKEVTLSKDFVASIKEHGVLVPIVAQETPDGLEVIDGQMRTLAAVDGELADVPVFVRAAVESDAARAVEQLVVNSDRQALTTVDEVAAVKQLALDFKMPVAQIAKRVGMPKARVDQVLAIAGNASAAAAVTEGQLTLEQAAKLAGAGLTKAQTKELVDRPYNFDHSLQRILDERSDAARVKELTAAAKKAGLKIVDPPIGPYDYGKTKNKHAYVSSLVDKVTGKAVNFDEHESCPGAGVYVGKKGGYGERSIEIWPVCTDPAKYGHRDKERSVPTPMTDAEKAQRRIDIDRGKQWSSITTVRTAWIRDLLTRKAAPAGWEALVASITLGDVDASRDEYIWKDTAHDLLQIEKVGYSLSAIRAAAARRPAMILLGVAIARVEKLLSDKKGWATASDVYLEALAGWGYTLAELEVELIAERKARAAKRAA